MPIGRARSPVTVFRTWAPLPTLGEFDLVWLESRWSDLSRFLWGRKQGSCWGFFVACRDHLKRQESRRNAGTLRALCNADDGSARSVSSPDDGVHRSEPLAYSGPTSENASSRFRGVRVFGGMCSQHLGACPSSPVSMHFASGARASPPAEVVLDIEIRVAGIVMAPFLSKGASGSHRIR
jgi:hypothetical protein